MVRRRVAVCCGWFLVLACAAEEAEPAPTPDSGADAPVDATDDASEDACAPPNAWRYATPGCGATATPTCGDPNQDACAITLCSCTGQTITGCQWADQAWESYGPCDAGAD